MRLQAAGPGRWPTLKRIYRDVRRRQFPWIPADRIGDDDLARRRGRGGPRRDGRRHRARLCLGLGGPDRFVQHLFVHLDHQGRGVGDRLLAFARKTYPPTLRLKCVAANRRALDFYLARGWRTLATGRDENGEHLLLESPPAT
jgi:Acetyltransferase (GNAT) family.